jgi:epoxide hydrolase-like predicted phosphatase
MRFRAVIFDLGGVVLDSPLHAIARYERDLGLPPGGVNRVVVDTGPEGAWSRLERGEIPLPVFLREFDAECARAGIHLSAAEMMERIRECGPRPRMLDAVARLRAEGLRVAALTNNWSSEEDGTGALRERFDFFLESSRLGMRKPDPRIYQHACQVLEVAPPEAVFLDDIGRNLKAARVLGMHTIKVDDPDAALDELGAILGLDLD